MVSDPNPDQSHSAVYTGGRIQLDSPQDWAEGTRLIVTPAPTYPNVGVDGHVIIVGFGLAGRYIADLLRSTDFPYIIVEKNHLTVETQVALGRNIIEGDVTVASTLVEAGLNTAAILALTIPDEDAVLKATALARRLRPEIYIIARTNYSSKGMQASQLGADDVVKAEQAVALQFYDKLSQRIRRVADAYP